MSVLKKRQVSLMIFYTPDKKILLQNRNFKWNPEIEWWYFGWWIEEWETKEEALIREIKDLEDYKFIWIANVCSYTRNL
jgi:hypothetical protein